MSALVFLLIVVVISAVGSSILLLRNRRPTSVESGVEAFRREMSALAPPDEGGTPAHHRRDRPAGSS